jgi:hypothetical protein
MFDGKFIATLFAIAVSIFAICNFNTKKITSHEGFGFGNLQSTTWRKERVCARNQKEADKGHFYIDHNYHHNNHNNHNNVDHNDDQQGHDQHHGYRTQPNYQANTTALFSNVNHGAHVRHSHGKQDGADVRYSHEKEDRASSCDPLTFGGMAREDFTKESFDRGEVVESNDSSKSHYDPSYQDALSMVPIGDMTTLNSLGEHHHTICYDRYIHSTKKSRKQSHGCPLRGDLAIIPLRHGGSCWMIPSSSVLDLRQGALSVMGGVQNATTQSVAHLVNNQTGQTTHSGVNMDGQINYLDNTIFGSAAQVTGFV